MVGLSGAIEGGSDAASAAEHGAAESSHLGTSEFQGELQRHSSELGELKTKHESLDSKVVKQLGAVHTSVGELNLTATAHGTRLDALDALTTRTAREHGSTQANQTTQLRSHDLRLTTLEAGRFQEPRQFTADDTNTNTARIANLNAVHDQDITSFTTGHGSKSRDQALQAKISSDPTVRLQQANLSRAITGMREANKPGAAGNPAEFLKAAEDAEKSAKELDAARKTLEATGVFQGGNSFSKYATKVNAAIAAVSIAAAGTTGGLIAANNETQRQKTKQS